MTGDAAAPAPAAEGPRPLVRVERQGHVAVVILDRPERLNAFTKEMGLELGRAYADCDADDDIRAVVLTGAGRAFCAGADTTPRQDTFPTAERGRFTASPISPPAWRVRKPVLAAVNGHAVGIGLTMALQCDIRIIAEDARLGLVQVRRGVLSDGQSHWTLPRLTGFAVAAELLLTGRMFTGADAVGYGIASRALPAVEVLPAALDVATEIATYGSPLSVALSKRLLWEGSQEQAAAIERLETEAHLLIMGAPDAREGVLAFLDKREPDWRSRVPRDWPEDLLPTDPPRRPS